MERLKQGERPKLVGMVHAKALPGAPDFSGDFDEVVAAALADAAAITDGGMDAIMVENFGDVPFFAEQVPAATVAALAVLVDQIRLQSNLPVGVNVLRNDGLSAIDVAAVTQAAMIRVNVLSGARVTDQGLVQGDAARLLRRRRELGAAAVQIWADVDVKHSQPIGAEDLSQSVADLVKRAKADALIVSGSGTGMAVDAGQLQEIRRVTDAPIVIGSGATPESVAALQSTVQAHIVGTGLKADGNVAAPVELARVRTYVEANQS